MSDSIRFEIDGEEVEAQPGQTILAAAKAAGKYIPHLCARPGLVPHGSCRLCVVKVNGRPQSACTQPVTANAVVENETEELQKVRRGLLEMLFCEGNHFCPGCEKSGNCELQALAYRVGVNTNRAHLFPHREVDASHDAALIDRNRCIVCARCVRTSRDVDGKHALDFVGRGIHKRLATNGEELKDTALTAADAALDACPTGSLLRKRVGFAMPRGERRFDHEPIGSDIERSAAKE